MWLTVCWLFRQIFGGDLLSQMSKPISWNIIDSWTDLKNKPNLRILASTDTGDLGFSENFSDIFGLTFMTKKSYISKESPYYFDFTVRLTVGSRSEIQKSDSYKLPDFEVLDLTKFDGNIVLMSVCETLRYRLYNAHCGRLENRLHVSSSGGDILPYFFIITSLAEKK